MIYIAYTTAKKEKRWFKFPIELPGLESALNKSSRARRVRDSNEYRDPSLGELVGGGVDIAFVATTPEEEAFVKIIPYEKTIDDSWCYNHDRETKRTDGCSCFELQNGLYVKIKSLGIEV